VARGIEMEGVRYLLGLPARSWRITAIVAAVIVLCFVAAILLATNTVDVRHANFPGHPYPPAGYYVNPFSQDPDDLVNAAQANQVKADLLEDGNIELRALETGDANLLNRSTTGDALAALRKLIDQNSANGVYEKDQSHIDSIVVGRLSDPNRSGVTWCIEEHGTGSVSYISKADGSVRQGAKKRFENRFWLERVGDRYLITDVEVRPVGGGGR
jgi:hypothetical protein